MRETTNSAFGYPASLNDVMENAELGGLRLNSVFLSIIYELSALGQIDRQSLATVGWHAWPE